MARVGEAAGGTSEIEAPAQASQSWPVVIWRLESSRLKANE